MQVVGFLAEDDALAGIAGQIPIIGVAPFAEQNDGAPLKILAVLERVIDALREPGGGESAERGKANQADPASARLAGRQEAESACLRLCRRKRASARRRAPHRDRLPHRRSSTGDPDPQRAMRPPCSADVGSMTSARRDYGKFMTLTCAATMRQPSGKRTQVCICRPILLRRRVAVEQGRRHREIAPVSRDLRPLQPPRQAGAGARRAKRLDLVVAVEVLGGAVADRRRRGVKEPIQRRDIVGGQSRLVGGERRPSTSALVVGVVDDQEARSGSAGCARWHATTGPGQRSAAATSRASRWFRCLRWYA